MSVLDNKKETLKRLKDFDIALNLLKEEIYINQFPIKIIIVGGSLIALLEINSRVTYDIDVVLALDKTGEKDKSIKLKREIEKIMPEYNISTKATPFVSGVLQLDSENIYEYEFTQFENISVYFPSYEVFVVMKLEASSSGGRRNYETDMDDIKNMKICNRVSFEKVKILFEEISDSYVGNVEGKKRLIECFDEWKKYYHSIHKNL